MTAPPVGRGGADGPYVLQRAEGIELIGELEGSGYKKTPYLVRRADGQIIKLTALLYLIARAADGRRDEAQVAREVSREYGKAVSAANVRHLVEKKLRPLGVLAAADGTSPKLERPDPLLALRFRTAVVPANVVRPLTTLFRPFFWPPVVAAVVAGLVAFDVWLFGIHGVADSVRASLYEPTVLLAVFALVVASAAFHEFGHAAACAYGGATPGVMGAGIYLAWPAFYTDVTDSYRLSRAGRLRTDLGGVYFNALFILVTAAVYFATGQEWLLLVVLALHAEMFHQFLPFLRLDGYYVLADATGVPDLFPRIKPILRSLVPGRDAPREVDELKPWVRLAVTAWVLTVIPILLFNLAVLVMFTPRLFATAWDSFQQQAGGIVTATADGDPLGVLAGALQIVLLALPLAGIVLTFGRLGNRLVRWLWDRAERVPAGRPVVGVATAAAAVFSVFILWPNGDYRPLQEDERLAARDVVIAFRHVGTGRPSLTQEQAEALGGAPWQGRGAEDPSSGTEDEPPSRSAVTASPSASPSADAATTTDASATDAGATDATTTDASATDAGATDATTTTGGDSTPEPTASTADGTAGDATDADADTSDPAPSPSPSASP